MAWDRQPIKGYLVDADTGETYGMLSSVYRTGANDVYAVQGKTGAEKLFPAIAQIVKSIDLEAGKMTISPIPGIFDDMEH